MSTVLLVLSEPCKGFFTTTELRYPYLVFLEVLYNLIDNPSS